MNDQEQKILREGNARNFAMALFGSIIHLTRMMSEEPKKQPSHLENADFVFDLFMNGAKQ